MRPTFMDTHDIADFLARSNTKYSNEMETKKNEAISAALVQAKDEDAKTLKTASEYAITKDNELEEKITKNVTKYAEDVGAVVRSQAQYDRQVYLNTAYYNKVFTGMPFKGGTSELHIDISKLDSGSVPSVIVNGVGTSDSFVASITNMDSRNDLVISIRCVNNTTLDTSDAAGVSLNVTILAFNLAIPELAGSSTWSETNPLDS